MPELVVNDVRLTYAMHGEGMPLLLVCGTGQPARLWSQFQVPAFVAAGLQVITFDNRGMPPSECPPEPYGVEDLVNDAAGLIEALGVGPCSVVGLSLGAFITQELALSRPDLVRAAVMVGTLARQDTFRRAMFSSWLELDQHGIALPRLYEAVVIAFASFSATRLCDDEAMSQYLSARTAAEAWGVSNAIGQHRADAAYDDRLEALSAIRVPSLVIGFEHDMQTPVSLCREVAAAIPGCQYEQVAGVGHGALFERPEHVNAVIVEFLKRLCE